MLVDRQALLADLKLCLPGVEKGTNASLEGFDTFWFDGGYIRTYNHRAAVSVPSSVIGLSCALDAPKFYKIISKLKAPQMEIAVVDGSIVFTCGKLEASMPVLDTKIQSMIKALGIDDVEFEAIPEGFLDAVVLCDIENNKSPQRGVYFDDNYALSSDGARANFCSFEGKSPTLYLDTPAVDSLIKLRSPKMMGFSKGWAHFQTDSGSILSVVVKNEKGFPADKVMKWINDIDSSDLLVGGKIPHTLGEAADRVAVFADTSAGAGRVRLRFTSTEIEISAKGEKGIVKESVSCETPLNDVDATFHLAVDAVRQACRVASEFYVVERGGKYVFVFLSGSYKQLVFAKKE